MPEENEKYVVIAEFKAEQPLVFETFLGSADYDSAMKMMIDMTNNKNCIRVAIAKLVYEIGNKDLLK